VTEYGPDSLFCDMPADLPPKRIWKYCDPTLHIWRERDVYHVGPPYRCSIGVYPEWEPEHGLSLEFSDGAIVTVNQARFEIVDGILREKPGAPVGSQEPEPPQPTAKEMALAYAKYLRRLETGSRRNRKGADEARRRDK